MQLKRFSIPLLILPLLIFSLGFMSLFSTAPDKASSQLVFFILGAFLYVLVSFLDYKIFKAHWKPFYFLTLFSLILTLISGEVRSGSSRWIDLGVFVFQPSEFAKISILLAIAALISAKTFSFASPKKVLTIFLLTIPIIALVFLQPDLGTSIVIFGVFLGVLLYAGLKKVYFLTAFLLLLAISAPVWGVLQDYQKKRVLIFLNVYSDRLGAGYNVFQSLISVGSGRLLGKGFGSGTQSHLKFLPVYWTDFIFASFAEEWGFVGVLLLLALYTFLLGTLLYVANKASDVYGKLICIGVFLIFFFQYIVNVGMNLSLMPVTGIPLSLVSHGGSSLIISMFLLGLVQSIWCHRKDPVTLSK